MPVPVHPKIYHIVHVDRLASIIAAGCLWSDSLMAQRQGGTVIGMGIIKERRLQIPVSCHNGINVGGFVPFYFAPRSIMLYLIYRANHPDLEYRGGQEPIVHLEADMHEAVKWSETNRRRWAFSLSNAGAFYTQFRARLDDLREVNWDAVYANDFRSDDIKEGKQAEFLVEQSFPWHLVERIGVHSRGIVSKVTEVMHHAAHRPRIEIKQEWYY
jgi:hypothetical protein